MYSHCFTRFCTTHDVNLRRLRSMGGVGKRKGKGRRYAVQVLVGALGVVDGGMVAEEQQVASAHEPITASTAPHVKDSILVLCRGSLVVCSVV